MERPGTPRHDARLKCPRKRRHFTRPRLRATLVPTLLGLQRRWRTACTHAGAGLRQQAGVPRHPLIFLTRRVRNCESKSHADQRLSTRRAIKRSDLKMMSYTHSRLNMLAIDSKLVSYASDKREGCSHARRTVLRGREAQRVPGSGPGDAQSQVLRAAAPRRKLHHSAVPQRSCATSLTTGRSRAAKRRPQGEMAVAWPISFATSSAASSFP